MRVTFEKLKDKCPTMEQFTDLLGKHMNKYNNTPSGGIDMDGKCPDQVYFENLAVKNEVHDKSILRILCGTFDERTVQKTAYSTREDFTTIRILSPTRERKLSSIMTRPTWMN